MELLMRYARAALVIGIALLGFAVHNLWLAFGGHAYVAREQLTALPVYVNSAEHVTVTGKRGVTRSEYYQLKVSLRDRVGQKELRMDIGLPEEIVAALIEENVNVLVDEENHSLVYEASVLDDGDEGEDKEYVLLSYDNMRDLLQEKAENRAKDPVWGVLGLLLTAAGIFGIRQKRKQQAAEEKAETTPT